MSAEQNGERLSGVKRRKIDQFQTNGFVNEGPLPVASYTPNLSYFIPEFKVFRDKEAAQPSPITRKWRDPRELPVRNKKVAGTESIPEGLRAMASSYTPKELPKPVSELE